MSGPFAVTAAARFPRMRAAASLYGVDMVTEEPDSPHRALDHIEGELYIGFAEIDPAVPATVPPELEKALKAAGTKYRMETYKDAHHGFCFAGRARLQSDRRGGKLDPRLRSLDRNLK